MLQPGRAVPSSGIMKIWLIYFAHLESVWIISVNIGHGKWGLGTYRAIWIIWAVQESSSDSIQEALQGENVECLSGSSEVANHHTNQWLETDLKCLCMWDWDQTAEEIVVLWWCFEAVLEDVLWPCAHINDKVEGELLGERWCLGITEEVGKGDVIALLGEQINRKKSIVISAFIF